MDIQGSGKCTQSGHGKSWKTTFIVSCVHAVARKVFIYNLVVYFYMTFLISLYCDSGDRFTPANYRITEVQASWPEMAAVG